MEYNLTEDTASPTSSPKPPPTATATSQLQASITTRRTRHRHTQSLGLLSPIPSSTSLCEQSRLSPHSSSPSPLRSTGHSPLRPLAATDSNTSTPSTRSASSHRSLSHKRTQSHSQASPYTAPHTPVAAGGPTPHTTPATTGNIQSATGNASGTTTPSGTKRASLPALLATLSALFPSSTTSTSTSASASMLPSPLSPTATSHNNTAIHYTAMQVASPQPRLGAMQPSNGTPQRPHTPSSRSEKLLRDALRRGSTSSPRPHVPSASSNPFAPVGHASHPSHHSHPSHPSYNNGHNGGSNATPAYGGDSEFSASAHHTSPSATALSHTLSRLEGRSPPPSQYGGNGRESSSPYGHGYGYGGNGNGGGNGGGNGRETREPRDPEHEALRARLERVLASGGGGSKPGSRRGSVNMRATSPLERERERERGQGQMSEWERLNERLGQERERERESTPRPRTPAMSDISEGSGAGTVGAGSPSPRTPTRARARGRTVDESPHTPVNAQHPQSPRRRTVDGESPYAHHGHTSPRLQHAQLPVSASASNSPLLRHQGVSTTTPLGSPLLRQSHLPGTPARGATTPNSHSPLARHHQLPATAAATTPDRDELARRHTVPAGTGTVESPRRPGFGAQYASASGYVSAAGSPRRSTFATHSQNSPSPHGVRPRAHTEPTEFADGWEAARDQERVHYERERQMQRERGHGRKSSAYAALAALSGLAGAPSHPGRAGNATTPNANANGYVAHPTYTQTATPGSTPPLSADLVDDDAESDEDDEGSRDRHTRRGGGKLLTPPATPPRHSLVVVAGEDSSSSFDGHPHDLHSHPHAHAQHHDEPRPAFNARKASAQCRQLEGYVSFAAVEGLGEPPSPSPSGASWDEDSEEGAGKRREGRGSIGAGIVGLWRGRGGFWS